MKTVGKAAKASQRDQECADELLTYLHREEYTRVRAVGGRAKQGFRIGQLAVRRPKRFQATSASSIFAT